jgi:putative flippase GtrA
MNIPGQAQRLAVVGLLAGAVHVGVALLLIERDGVAVPVANALAFLLAMPVSYGGNHAWTFRRQGGLERHYPRFLAIAVLGLALNQAIVLAAVTVAGLPYLIAIGIVAPSVPGLTFLANRHWAIAAGGEAPAARSAGRLEAAAPALALGALWLTGLAFYLPAMPHHDVSWYLLAADRFLGGARLYRDIIELNPPLIVLLNAPPVAFARLSGFNPSSCFVVYVFLLVAGSLALSDAVLRRFTGLARRDRLALLFAALAALTFLPMENFGQREHLMLTLALPYLLLAAARLAGSPVAPGLALSVGLAAALGLGLKPYFLIVPLLLEVLLSYRRRSLTAFNRPETWAAAAGLVAYAVSVWVFFPEYLSVIAPYALIVYDAYQLRPGSIFRLLGLLPLILSPALAFALARPRPGATATGAVAETFALAGAGFLIAYVVQAKGWFYHFLPAEVAGWMMAVGLLLNLLGHVGGQNRRRTRIGCVVVALGILTLPALLQGPYRNGATEKIMPYVRTYAEGGSIFAFTSYMSLAFPLVTETGVGWSSRYPTQWLLPGLLHELAKADDADTDLMARLRGMEKYVFDSTIEDLERQPPDLVIVDQEPGTVFDDPDFDFLDYFLRDERFARFWRDYVRLAHDDRYEYWCRRNPARNCGG